MSHHRIKDPESGALLPRTDYAKFCDDMNARMVDMIRTLDPKLWFIENPRGALRKMPFMAGLPRYTVTYCQYGMPFQKPTDIWTNCVDPKFKPACKRGAPCHVPSPRGCRTGVQGIEGTNKAHDRARLPDDLCEHIVRICEEYI